MPLKMKGGDKDKPTPPAGGANLATILAAIKKEKGDQVVVTGSTIPVVPRQETGIFEFDFKTCGGFPRGRYSIVYGPESSGKTNLVLKAIARAQKRKGPCNKAVYVNLEQTFDPVWAAKMGVDVDALIVVNPAYGEEAVDLIDALMRATDVAILVVDTVAVLVANKELEQSAEAFDVGTSSLLIKRLVNKMMYAFGASAKIGHYPCVILVNQIRFKIGVMFGDPETMPGGEAQKFLASLRIRTSGKNITDKGKTINLLKETHCIIKKSKVPVLSTNFTYQQVMYAHDGLEIGETNSWAMVKNELTSLGMLSKQKGWQIDGEFKILEGKDGKPIKFVTQWAKQEDIEKQYLKDEEFRIRIQSKVIAAYQGKAIFVEEVAEPFEHKFPATVPSGTIVQSPPKPEVGWLVGKVTPSPIEYIIPEGAKSENAENSIEEALKVLEELGSHMHVCPACGSVWPHEGEQATCLLAEQAVCENCL